MTQSNLHSKLAACRTTGERIEVLEVIIQITVRKTLELILDGKDAGTCRELQITADTAATAAILLAQLKDHQISLN